VDIYPLQVFLEVYRHRNFSRAAEALHLSQPSVSAYVKRLEDELGVRLFDRVGRKTHPTAEGERLYARAGDLLRQMETLRQEFRPQEEGLSGLISIAATSLPGTYVLPPALAAFRAEHPGIFFELVIKESKAIASTIRTGEQILGVINEEPRGKDIAVLHRIEDELVLATKPGFIKPDTILPTRLFSIPLLMREEGSDSRASMEKQHLLHRVSLKMLNITAIFGSTDAVKEAVKSGLGAAILSRYAIRDEVALGLIRAVKVKGVTMRRSFFVVAHAQRTLPPSYQAFVEFLKENR